MEMITRHIICFVLHRSKLKFKLAANIASRREHLPLFFPSSSGKAKPRKSTGGAWNAILNPLFVTTAAKTIDRRQQWCSCFRWSRGRICSAWAGLDPSLVLSEKDRCMLRLGKLGEKNLAGTVPSFHMIHICFKICWGLRAGNPKYCAPALWNFVGFRVCSFARFYYYWCM